MKTTTKNSSILNRLGLTKADIKEALKFKPKPKIQRRGSVSPVKTPCKCGGTGMLQQWIESDSKLYAMVFCQECECKTKIYSERTLNESRQEALNEWNIRNRK